MKYHQPYGITDTDAPYINGDPSQGREGSIPPAESIEYPQREIANLIASSQQVPSDTDLHQLTRGVRDGKLNYAIDVGIASGWVVGDLDPTLPQYQAGMILRVLVLHAVTGPTTLRVGSLPDRAVRRTTGAELSAGDVPAGAVACLVDDGTQWQLMNYNGLGGGGTGGPTTVYQIDIPYCHDSGAVNALIGIYSPAITSVAEGDLILIKLLHAVTGPTTIVVNALPIRNVVHGDGTPINAGDGAVGQIWLLVFDGINWQLIGGPSGAAAAVAPPSGSGKSLSFTRFTQATQTYLLRTPPVASNRQMWTYSMFVKRNTLAFRGSYKVEPWFNAGDTQSDWNGCYWNSLIGPDGTWQLYWNQGSSPIAGPDIYGGFHGYEVPVPINDLIWHHYLWLADGATLSLYFDGVLKAQGAITGNSTINSVRPHVIGSLWSGGADGPFGSDVKMAEVYFVDGLALSWQNFAQAVGTIFLPKSYSGVFGTNGFYLNWSDSTNIGKDWSGRANNWVPYNFSTADISNDFPGMT